MTQETKNSFSEGEKNKTMGQDLDTHLEGPAL